MKKVINIVLPVLGVLLFIIGSIVNLKMDSLLLKVLKYLTIILFLFIIVKDLLIPLIKVKRIKINILCIVYITIFIVHLFLIPPFTDKYFGGNYDESGRCSYTTQYNYFNEMKSGYYDEGEYSVLNMFIEFIIFIYQ